MSELQNTEKFIDSCQKYYEVFTNKIDSGYKYQFLSPFEFKNILINYSNKYSKKFNKPILNAGRGQPNFFSTLPRLAYSLLLHISTKVCEIDMNASLGFKQEKKGISKKFFKLLKKAPSSKEKKFLYKAILKIKRLNPKFNDDNLINSIIYCIIGNKYPDPPRILTIIEPILTEYLEKIIYKPLKSFQNKISLFPVEGASAAMVYVFNSLKYNGLLVPGDNIAIITPIFSPYLEIPSLQVYNLNHICIQANESNNWEISKDELNKLTDPKIKALFLVNPANPYSLSLSSSNINYIKHIVKNINPNLIIITDNVYAPFVNNFNNLFTAIPYNTIGIFSYSKYFGVTGCRLGVIALHNHNIIDNLFFKVNDPLNNKRYSIITREPQKIKFIDRLLIDSRQVALAHTAGLSTPQQMLMALFSLYDLSDKGKIYRTELENLLQYRIDLLLKPLHSQLNLNDLASYYYVIIDLISISNILYSDTHFNDYLLNNNDPLEFILKLAKQFGTIVLPTLGFAGPFWGIRISMANLPSSDYQIIGENIKLLLNQYYEKFKNKK
jgi:aspartate 4-decarboxylase